VRCLACNVELNAFEQRRKYKHHEQIANPEDKYIGLCDRCFYQGDLDELNLEETFPQGE
jgi:hypothetical protein